MKTRVLIALCCLGAGTLAVGCQESTAPRGNYHGLRTDRGMNTETDSPSVADRPIDAPVNDPVPASEKMEPPVAKPVEPPPPVVTP